MNSELPIRVLGIAGSLRHASHNGALIRAAAELSPPSVTFDVFEGLEGIPVFNDDMSTSAPPAVADLRAAIKTSQGVLIATPEYNRSVPGTVKNLIDWLSIGDDKEGLTGRPVAVTGATTGPWGTRIAQVTLQQMLVSVGAYVLPSPSLYIPHAETVFDADGQLVDPTTADRLADLVASLERWVRVLSAFEAA